MHLFRCGCNPLVSLNFTLSICMELLNHWMNFCEIWCLRIYEKLSNYLSFYLD
jgi:hypothetical protein